MKLLPKKKCVNRKNATKIVLLLLSMALLILLWEWYKKKPNRSKKCNSRIDQIIDFLRFFIEKHKIQSESSKWIVNKNAHMLCFRNICIKFETIAYGWPMEEPVSRVKHLKTPKHSPAIRFDYIGIFGQLKLLMNDFLFMLWLAFVCVENKHCLHCIICLLLVARPRQREVQWIELRILRALTHSKQIFAAR